MIKKLKFHNICFYNDNFKYISKIFLKKKGYLVAPAASSLNEIYKNNIYRQSLVFSDIAIFDSGFFCILLNIFKNTKVKKLSGYLFLKKFFDKKNIKSKKIFLINPTLQDQHLNNKFLRKNGFYNYKSVVVPKYNKSNFRDYCLLNKIKFYRPQIILINIGGGLQEPMAFFIKKNIKFKVSILCTGAAIGFITGIQAPINEFYDKYYLGWLVRLVFKPKNYISRVIKSFQLIRLF